MYSEDIPKRHRFREEGGQRVKVVKFKVELILYWSGLGTVDAFSPER